jgi:hypothetical protein
MKKILVMAVAALMVTLRVSAQHEEGDLTIQPRVGVTMSNITNTDGAKMKLNVTFGVEFEHFFTDEFSVAAGVLFTDQGAKLDDDVTMNIYYGHLPVTLNYYVLPGLAVKAGIQPGFRVKANVNEDGTKIDFDKFLATLYPGEDVKMSTFDLAFPVGLSYEYSRVTLDARYNWSVLKLIKGIDKTVRNSFFAVTLGYKF